MKTQSVEAQPHAHEPFGLCPLVVAIAVGVLSATATANRYTPGAPGLGDPFFPLAGNGGYDVQKYTLKIDYDPATDRLDDGAVPCHRLERPLRP